LVFSNAIPVNINGICQPFTPGAYNAANGRFVGCFASTGPMATLSKLHHEIHGVGVLQAIENVPECAQLIRMSSDNIKQASNDPTDPFFIIETGDTVAANSEYTLTRNFDSHKFRKNSYLETILKNANRQGLMSGDLGNQQKTVTLSSYLPLSFFQEQNKVYQSRHILRMFIDPNWKQNLIMSMYANAPIDAADKRFCTYTPNATDPNPTFVDANGIIATNSIALSITDVWLECTMLKTSERPMGIRNILMNPFNVTINNIAAGQTTSNFTISCAPHTHKILIGFRPRQNGIIDPLPVNVGLGNPEDATRVVKSGIHTIFTAPDIQDITVRYLDNAYPETPYRLQFYGNNLTSYSRLANAATIDVIPKDLPTNYSILDQGDNVRAYNDFLEAMEYDHCDRPMSYTEWLHNPLYCFRFLTTTNLASNVDIKINFRTAPTTPIDMYTLYYHKGLLTCDFQENDVNYTYNYLV
jgi:hypothetical protein